MQRWAACRRNEGTGMLRWLGALLVVCAITGVLACGLVPFYSIGVARTLFAIFSVTLACSLAVGIVSWR